MKGIDISPYQGTINFQAVKDSGVEIVYIKATEGRTFVADTLKDYYNQAKAVGLKVGFYHFLRANNPIDEANNYLNAIAGLQADCKHAIDVELYLGQSKDQVSSNVKQFADYLLSKGQEIVVYTYSSFYNDFINDSVKGYPLWIANYSNNEPNINHVGWQYSEHGRVPGIGGDCDLDNFTDGILIGGQQVQNNFMEVNTLGAIKQGENSDRVRLLQSILSIFVGGVSVDGSFGQQTHDAVVRYQQIMGIGVDGVVGQETANVLYNDIKNGWFKL